MSWRKRRAQWNAENFPVYDQERVRRAVCKAVAARSGGELDFRVVGRAPPQLVQVVANADIQDWNREMAAIHGGDVRHPDYQPPYPRVKGKSAILAELGRTWGLSRTRLFYFCRDGRDRLSWRVAERLLDHLTPLEAVELRSALFSPAIADTRQEYLTATTREVERLAALRGEGHDVPWTGAAKRLGDSYGRKVADLGVPPERARLMHLRVWDAVVAYPRLHRELRGRALERLLKARYTAELDTINREMLAYREMVPFARRPRLLGERRAPAVGSIQGA
jgi:hypothetical protein